MSTSFLLFFVAFIVVVFASCKIVRIIKDIFDATKGKDLVLEEKLGPDLDFFHARLVIFMATFARKLRLDVGSIQFIYDYIKKAVPQNRREDCILVLVNSTYVLDNNRDYPIIDINKTSKNDQLVFVDDNLKKMSEADVEHNFHTDDEVLVEVAQVSYNRLSETTRKYIAYLLCKTACAALSDKPDFLSMKDLLVKAFSLGADDVHSLLSSAGENKLSDWYEEHIKSDANKKYPSSDVFVDIPPVEYPSMPPYDWRKKIVNRANLWSAALYFLLSVLTVWGLIQFQGPSLLLFAVIPLLILCPIFSVSSIFCRFFDDHFVLEENKFNLKPTTVHFSLIVYAAVTFLALSIEYVMNYMGR